MFSFTPTKNITTGEGGMVTTDDSELAQRLRLLRDHGQTGLYEHRVLGYNWRLSDIQAAIGSAQVAKLPAILRRTRDGRPADRSPDRSEGGVRPPVTRPDREHTFMLYTVLVEHGRDAVMAALASEGIEARLYFPPAHLQPVFQGAGAVGLPVTEWLADRMLSLPCHAGMSAADVDEVTSRVRAAVLRDRQPSSGRAMGSSAGWPSTPRPATSAGTVRATSLRSSPGLCRCT